MIADATEIKDWGILTVGIVSATGGALAAILTRTFGAGWRRGKLEGEITSLRSDVEAVQGAVEKTDARIERFRYDPSKRLVRLEDRSSKIEEWLAKIEDRSIRAEQGFTALSERLTRIKEMIDHLSDGR